MRILWFTNTPSLYEKVQAGYNGGGWIEALEQYIARETEIKLGIGFFHHDQCFKVKKGNTTYYPISLDKNFGSKLRNRLLPKQYEKMEVDAFLKVINDFKPDIIHIFGSEKSFGLVSAFTHIPVVIHIQGILGPCLNAFFPPGTNLVDWVKTYGLHPLKAAKFLRTFSIFKRHVRREEKILRENNYYMGRTSWDRDIISVYAPGANYFHCGELLRDDFYAAQQWKPKKAEKFVLVSTISKIPYKGFDTILKAAKLLARLHKIDFEWKIFGVDNAIEFERLTNINCVDVNITVGGVVDSKSLVSHLLASDAFVHLSYIDNSPNSVCEAQLIGLPVIATNTGGIPSLIEHGKTGFLVPTNDPFSVAKRVLDLQANPELCYEIGANARSMATKRHDKTKIRQQLMSIYNELYQKQNAAVVH